MTAQSVPSVYIVILNWNGWKDTIDCLNSLKQTSYSNYVILVVDNGSADESVAQIHSKYPTVEIIETQANFGFAGGNNVGIKEALKRGAEYVFLLNNDTIVDPRMLSYLVQAITGHPGAAFVGPKTFYASEPKRIWFYGSAIEESTGRAYHWPADVIDGPGHQGTFESAYCPGSALLMRSSVLHDIGLLDQRFFVIHEDADWCLRAQRAGWKGYVVGPAIMWHKVSASFNRSSSTPGRYYFVRNGLELSARLRPNHRIQRVFLFAWQYAVWEPLRAIRHRKPHAWRAWAQSLAGVCAFIFRLFGPAPGWISL